MEVTSLHSTCTASARRGRRCPARAHAGAVGAARRLRCGARPGVASHNSLRSLRSLRSNRCAESVHEARCARRPQSCAPRRPRNRPRRAPPAATWNQSWCLQEEPPLVQQRRVRAGSRRASEAPRSAGLVGRARSAHQQLTSGSCLNAAAKGRVVSSARPAKTEQRKAALASRGPRRQGRFLWFLSLSTQRKELGCRAETPARPHAVN